MTTSATASGPAEDRKLSKLSANDNPTKRPGKAEKRKGSTRRGCLAHAAVRAAAAAVDAALAGDARVDADADADAVPENPENPEPPFAEGTPSPSEDERIPIVTPTETPREDPEDPEDPAGEPRSVRAEKASTKLDPAGRERLKTSTDPVQRTDVVRPVPLAETKDLLPDDEGSSGSSPSSSTQTQRARRSETTFDADLIDLVDEVDELRLFAGDDASGDARGARRRFGRDSKTDCPYTRPANPRAAAAAARPSRACAGVAREGAAAAAGGRGDAAGDAAEARTRARRGEGGVARKLPELLRGEER